MMFRAFLNLLLLAVLICALAYLLFLRSRRLSGRLAGEFRPASAPPPSWTSRIAEALVLACIGVSIFVLIATARHTGGRLTSLGEVPSSLARTHLLLAASAAIGVLIAVLLALLYRTWAGAILMALVLLPYGIALNSQLPKRITPSDEAEPAIAYAISLDAGDIVGADLWVNGIHLGKLPVSMPLDELLAEVPYWPNPPDDYEDEKVTVEYPYYLPGGGKHRYNRNRWIKFELPAGACYRLPPEARAAIERKEKLVYYARISLGDEWAYGRHSRTHQGKNECYTSLEVVFPEREKRLEMLFDKARLADYRVGPDWFAAIETYGDDGWLALRKNAEREPRMIEVLDAWASWRYGLNKTTDPDSAWEAFQRICDEADARQSYFTPTGAGRAVELLLPHLPHDRLVKKAKNLARFAHTYHWILWEINGRFHFGFTYSSKLPHLGGRYVSSGGYWSSRHPGTLPISAYAVAHAIWLLDESLDSTDDTQPNLVETEIVPELIRQYYLAKTPMSLNIATHLGGPEIERFLLRHNWHADVKFPSRSWRENGMDIGGGLDVNRWLYLLANLHGPEGTRFREQHTAELLNLADRIFENRSDDLHVARFLFLDLDRGKQNLAARYWRTYLARSRESDDVHAHFCQLAYLSKMEPIPTADTYLDVWRHFDSGHPAMDIGSDSVAFLFSLDVLPDHKHRAVLEAMIRDVQRKIADVSGQAKARGLRRLLPALEQRLGEILLRAADPDYAERRLAELTAPGSENSRNIIADWLERSRQDHPLLRLLAQDESPALRGLPLRAIESHPTPPHRAVLTRLLQDPDENVRARAEEVHAKLEQLAAIPPHDLVAVIAPSATAD